ncbi:uncharacterized protein METZ01_LOCUS81034 [marine metagenome]|uniref:Uncharacterized protein n=1 Tax=marine metagenome TaxID=408172 RepID=A0A381UJ67_9ZZZZ
MAPFTMVNNTMVLWISPGSSDVSFRSRTDSQLRLKINKQMQIKLIGLYIIKTNGFKEEISK